MGHWCWPGVHRSFASRRMTTSLVNKDSLDKTVEFATNSHDAATWIFRRLEDLDLASPPGRPWAGRAWFGGQLHHSHARQHGCTDHLVRRPQSEALVLLRGDGAGRIPHWRLRHVST